MVIAGGRGEVKYTEGGEEYAKTLDVVHSNGMIEGIHCGANDLPELPKNLEGFGMASKKDRFIYVCGGQDRGPSCFNNCGNYLFILLIKYS